MYNLTFVSWSDKERDQKLTVILMCCINDESLHDLYSDQVNALQSRLGVYETQLRDANQRKITLEDELKDAKQQVSDLQVWILTINCNLRCVIDFRLVLLIFRSRCQRSEVKLQG